MRRPRREISTPQAVSRTSTVSAQPADLEPLQVVAHRALANPRDVAIILALMPTSNLRRNKPRIRRMDNLSVRIGPLCSAQATLTPQSVGRTALTPSVQRCP